MSPKGSDDPAQGRAQRVREQAPPWEEAIIRKALKGRNGKGGNDGAIVIKSNHASHVQHKRQATTHCAGGPQRVDRVHRWHIERTSITCDWGELHRGSCTHSLLPFQESRLGEGCGGNQKVIIEMDQNERSVAKQLLLARRIRGVFRLPIERALRTKIHRRPRETPSTDDIPGRIPCPPEKTPC